MGELPRVETKQAIIPNKGDIRDLVLPGGGTLSLQLWAGIRSKVFQIQKWMKKERSHTPHMVHALKEIEEFADAETSFAEHAFKTTNEKEQLMIRCEIYFLVEACKKATPKYELENLLEQLGNMQ